MRTRGRRTMALSGHPDVSWSILAEAGVEALPDPDAVAARLREAIASHPRLGPVPEVGTVGGGAAVSGGSGPASVSGGSLPGGAAAVRAAFADEPYSEPGPVLRVALISGHPPSVLVAAHHGALDGLGLLALLGVVLGARFASSVRGLGSRRPAAPFVVSAALRTGEALLAPPARIEPDPGPHPGAGGPGRGDHLLALDLPAHRIGTAAAVAGAALAARRWNREHGAPDGRRMAVAVGASRRPGAELGLQERSAYLRIRIGAASAGDEDAVRALLAAARPEPPAPAGRAAGLLATPAGLLAGLLSARLGSTLLVSNLGSVHGPPGLRSVAFHPVAHGRSGVAVGLATVGDTTTLTVRARRRDFGPEAAAALLHAVAAEFRPGPGEPRMEPGGPQM